MPTEAGTTFPLYISIEVSIMKFDPYYHHRRSIRLKEYDYSTAGLYFITMCSLNRANIFTSLNVGAGLAPAQNDVSDHTSINISYPDPADNKLTRIGKILDNQWNKLPFYFKNIILDEYVVLPNHFHGIIVIGKNAATTTGTIDVEGVSPSSERAPARGAPTIGLGSVIGSFKSRCITENLTYIKENMLNESGKFWQRNYYERIIRNHNELNRIRNYIWNNPGKLLLEEEKLTR